MLKDGEIISAIKEVNMTLEITNDYLQSIQVDTMLMSDYLFDISLGINN